MVCVGVSFQPSPPCTSRVDEGIRVCVTGRRSARASGVLPYQVKSNKSLNQDYVVLGEKNLEHKTRHKGTGLFDFYEVGIWDFARKAMTKIS